LPLVLELALVLALALRLKLVLVLAVPRAAASTIFFWRAVQGSSCP
jgi:hypothetical protein